MYFFFIDLGGGATKRFNDTNNEWVFAKFLPLNTFNDATQATLSITVAYLVQRFLFMNVVSKGSVFTLLKNPITALSLKRLQGFRH